MEEQKKVTITVKGNKYPITTSESPAYVQGLSYEIDKTINQVIEQNENISLNEALVLMCISYLDAYKKEQRNSDNLRRQVAEYLEDAAKAREEAEEAKREIKRLEKDLEEFLMDDKGDKA